MLSVVLENVVRCRCICNACILCSILKIEDAFITIVDLEILLCKTRNLSCKRCHIFSLLSSSGLFVLVIEVTGDNDDSDDD